MEIHLHSGQNSTEVASDPLFQQEVYPILEQKCLACHEGAGAAAGLQMQEAAGLWRGGVSGAAVVSANATDSLIIQRIDLPEIIHSTCPLLGSP